MTGGVIVTNNLVQLSCDGCGETTGVELKGQSAQCISSLTDNTGGPRNNPGEIGFG